MKRFRIQIIELNNGIKEYVPQVGFVGLSKRCMINIPITSWENINYVNGRFDISITMSSHFKTEDEALQVIQHYKQFVEGEFANKPKKVEFKEIV
jgi:hypothetical protein